MGKNNNVEIMRRRTFGPSPFVAAEKPAGHLRRMKSVLENSNHKHSIKQVMKLIIVILLIIPSVACTRTQKWSITLHKSVVNTTDKMLLYEVETDEGIKREFVRAFDSVNVTFHKERDVERNVLTTTVHQNGIRTERETVFNLTDTTMYRYDLAYSIIPQTGNTEDEKIFARQLTWTLGDKSTDENGIIIIRLNVTDSIVNIMRKDYTMPDKFREHYAKKQ